MVYLDILTAYNMNQDLSEKISDKIVTFNELSNQWPTIKLVENYDDATHCFKLGNT